MPELSRRRRVGRLLLWTLAVLVLVAGAGAFWLHSRVRASLPELDGEVMLAGLGAAVTLERDAAGVVTIRGQSRVDVARGLGFAHGQDRFFQMDLARRRSAGELAELIGGAALPLDRKMRVHRFRHRAGLALAALAAEERRLVDAYAEGVNAGLASLGEKPFEYLVLRAAPAPWRPEDLIMVLYAMYVQLNDESGRIESHRGLIHDFLGPEMLAFLDPLGTEWDAPMVGPAYRTPPIPGPEILDLRTGPETKVALAQSLPSTSLGGGVPLPGGKGEGFGISSLGGRGGRGGKSDSWRPSPSSGKGEGFGISSSGGRGGRGGKSDSWRPSPSSGKREGGRWVGWARERGEMRSAGSNNWAVAGAKTTDGRALLANDMHLGHGVPNIWYRASLVYPDDTAPGGERRVSGVSLPGTPFIVAGSNGQVAWGFTNTWGDWGDLVVLEPGPPAADGAETYRTPNGPLRFERRSEAIEVAGGDAETLEVLETIWGPVVDHDHRGRRRALSWIAHARRGATLALAEVERATGLEEALMAANRVGAPPQNFVAADSGGRVGWTVMGPIPRRFGHDGRVPSSWADGERGWDGFLEPDGYPRLVDPEEGLVWSANARVVGGEEMAKIGTGTYRLGARQQQIRDGLRLLEQPAERDLLALQLDDRAVFLGRWRELLLAVLAPEAIDRDPRRAELRRLVEEWGGRAAVDSVGYRLVRAYRLFLAEEVLGAITTRLREADPEFEWDVLFRWEGALWRMVGERPAHLLDPRFGSWNERLLAAVDDTLDYFERIDPDLSRHTWGARNTVAIRHPLSPFLPGSGRWLDMRPVELPGDSYMPRYQGPGDGASERFAVSPGREEDGIFHMPTGQSGHPLSPFYRAGHQAWVEGAPTPFLPGGAQHTLRLVPR